MIAQGAYIAHRLMRAGIESSEACARLGIKPASAR